MTYMLVDNQTGEFMDRIFSMIIRRLLSKGVNAGIKAVANRGARRNGGEAQDQTQGQAQGQAQQGRPPQQAQQGVRGVRQASKMLRRISKF